MVETVDVQQIMLAAIAGALVVLFGAVHALFLALAKLGQSRRHLWVSYLAYGLFVVATLVLGWTLHLTGFWLLLILCMLLGYLVAPYAIWHLSVATHGPGDGHDPELPNQGVHEGDRNHE